MNIYVVDSEFLGPAEGGTAKVTMERCFVEASSMSAALALCKEDDGREVVAITRVGSISARERVDRT